MKLHMPNIGLAEGLLLDLGGLAHLVAEVVQLGATDIALTGDLDLVDLRGVHREGTLNADGEADLTDGERLANAIDRDDGSRRPGTPGYAHGYPR